MARLLQTCGALKNSPNQSFSLAETLETSPVGNSSKPVSAGVLYKPVPMFPAYRVGDDGTVWSSWRRIGLPKRHGSKMVIGMEWWKIKPRRSRYLNVTLYNNSGAHVKSVHQIVLESFVGPRPRGMQARHFPDRNPQNNRLENLRWGTPKANQADRIIHGTVLSGERCPAHKLSDDAVHAIREAYTSGAKSAAELGIEYGVWTNTIYTIVKRKTWKHI